jgi:hypothetical protein
MATVEWWKIAFRPIRKQGPPHLPECIRLSSLPFEHNGRHFFEGSAVVFGDPHGPTLSYKVAERFDRSESGRQFYVSVLMSAEHNEPPSKNVGLEFGDIMALRADEFTNCPPHRIVNSAALQLLAQQLNSFP